jgi:HEAT repeat protein
VRRCSVEAMWYYPDEEHLDRILNTFWFDNDEEVRGRAAMVLGRYMYEGFVMEELDPPLAKRVKRALLETSADEGESVTVRRFALEALSFCTDDPKVLNLIEQGYFAPDQRMQLSALFSMGRSGLERWHGYLLRALDESDKEFRIEAISACGEAQIISAVPELQKMCFDMDRDIRLEAIWALGKIGDERALHTLQRCARDADPEVSEVAHDAIEELGIAAAIARGEYTEALEEDDLIDFDADDDADWEDDADAEDERE